MKRRHFIAQTSLATVGLAASSGLLGKELLSSPDAKLDQLGFQVYTVRNQVKDNLEPTLEKLAKFGYDYAELYGLADGKVMGHPVKYVRKAFDDVGIEIRSTHCGTGQGAKQSGSMSYEWQKGVDAASELGAKHAVCAYLVANERKTLDDYKKVADLLNKCGETTSKSGMQMGYHNHAFEYETLEGQMPMDILTGETDQNLVKIELDLYWLVKAKRDPIEEFKKLAGRVNLWHVKDMEKGAKEGMAEVGKGRIDWKNIFANAGLSGMTGFFVEQDGNWAKSDIESLGTSSKYLKKLRF